MEIIDLKKEFIPTLAKWHYEQWSYLHANDSVEGRSMWLDKQLGSTVIPMTWVAVSGEKLLGSASLIEHDMDTRMDLSPWLASVYVDAEQRKQGTGSLLVRHVAGQAASLGYGTIYLFTDPGTEDFYGRLGWSLLERTEYKDTPTTIMEIHPSAPAVS